MRRMFFGVVLATLTALTMAPQTGLAASGARVDLRCEGKAGPVDLRACLPDSTLEVSREGTKTAYTASDLESLGNATDGTLSLIMPHNFSVKVQNTGQDVSLYLTVRTPSGAPVHEGAAERFGWVQFYHCGPQVDPRCREYNYRGQK